MIRLRHETLPAGLSAVLRRTPDGGLDIVVSSALSASRQRAAVRMALRAAGPADRRAALLPAPALVMLALARAWLRPLVRGHGLQLAGTAVALTAAAAAAVVVVAGPHRQVPAVAGRPPAGRVQERRPAGRNWAATPRPGAAQPSRRPEPHPSGQPLPPVVPVAARPASSASTQHPSAVPPSAAAASSPAATPGPPVPQPSPSPSAGSPGSGGGACLDLLGIWICL